MAAVMRSAAKTFNMRRHNGFRGSKRRNDYVAYHEKRRHRCYIGDHRG
jgi:hypothetical protein